MIPINEIRTVQNIDSTPKILTKEPVAADSSSAIDLILNKNFKQACSVVEKTPDIVGEIDAGKSNILHHIIFAHDRSKITDRMDLARLVINKSNGDLCLSQNDAGLSPLEAAIYHNNLSLFQMMLLKVQSLFIEKKKDPEEINLLFGSLKSAINRRGADLSDNYKHEFLSTLTLFKDKASKAVYNRTHAAHFTKIPTKKVTKIPTKKEILPSPLQTLFKREATRWCNWEEDKENSPSIDSARLKEGDVIPSKAGLNTSSEEIDQLSRSLIATPHRDSPLQNAIRNEDLFSFEEIFKRSSKDSLLYVNHKGETALYTAIQKGSETLALQLFRKCPEAICNIITDSSDTAFTLALEKGHTLLIVAIIQELENDSSLRAAFESSFKGARNQVLPKAKKVVPKLRNFAQVYNLKNLVEWTNVEPVKEPIPTTSPGLLDTAYLGGTTSKFSTAATTSSQLQHEMPLFSTSDVAIDAVKKSLLLLETIDKMTIKRKLTQEEMAQLGPKDKLPVNDLGFNALQLLILNKNTEGALQVIEYVDKSVLTQSSINQKLSAKALADRAEDKRIIDAINKKLEIAP